MDYSTYEVYDFDRVSAFHMSTGYKERSYQAHWHSYGEILLVGPGKTNIYSVGRNRYELVPDDLVIVWPMEMHSIVDADREESLVIQFSSAFINSLFDLRRIMH
ncbi:MAG: AraC family ligand binding domain-containing protein, partial [Lachnospiraceae bacterium]|nr:AraC family ligand binding domain-containing protein [Lachnospiraceae bacterium]